MKIAIIGTGYVGLTQGACLAEIGHHVVCGDIDEKKIAALRSGEIGIYEPGLDDMVDRNVAGGRLSFTTDLKAAIADADIVYSAVGTPPDKDHRADLSAVYAVAQLFAETVTKYTVLVNKSTVPVGTAHQCKQIIETALEKRGVSVEFAVVSNPEFLREGTAVQDCLKPDRIVVGAESDRERELLRSVYTPIIEKGAVFLSCTVPSAEVIKYASNALLATKISFMNEIALLAEKVGADITEIERGVGLDSRIGRRFLHAGIGYGGSCFPKDIDALVETGKDNDMDFKIIDAVRSVNRVMKTTLPAKLNEVIVDLNGKRVAVWGLAFKPKTDDMREAPSVEIIRELQKRGAEVVAYDPEAIKTAKRVLSDVSFANSALEAIDSADALLLVTEWDEFRAVDFSEIKKRMRGAVVGDGRNIWKPEDVRAQGFTYFSIGRI